MENILQNVLSAKEVQNCKCCLAMLADAVSSLLDDDDDDEFSE